MNTISVICAPYDSGYYNARMGRGPEVLSAIVAEACAPAGVDIEHITVSQSFPTEIATSFAVMRGTAAYVRRARDNDRFCVVLSGNCNAAVGVYAGLHHSENDIFVVWCDRHADFNTPETTTSGFLDGMGLAMLTGRCWRSMCAGIPGFAPIAESNVALFGATEMDAEEAEVLNDTKIFRANRTKRCNGWSATGRAAYLHVDLDLFDLPLNPYATGSGVGEQTLNETVWPLIGARKLLALSLSSYDPQYAKPNSVRNIVSAIVKRALAQSEVA